MSALYKIRTPRSSELPVLGLLNVEHMLPVSQQHQLVSVINEREDHRPFCKPKCLEQPPTKLGPTAQPAPRAEVSGQFKGTGSGQFKGKGKSKSKAQQDKWAAQCNGMTVAMIRRKRKQHSDPGNKVQNKERSMRRDKKKEKFQKALRNAMCMATTNMTPVSEDESLVPSTIKQARLAVLLEEKLAERAAASHESMDVATSHKAMDADFETSHQAMDVDFDPNGVPKTPDDDTESESEAASPEYSYLCDKTCE